MSLTRSHHAYVAEFEVLDSALAKPAGVRIPFDNHGSAINYRHRLNHARAVDRAESTKLYSPGDLGYNRSGYDVLICKVRNVDGRHYVYIEKNRAPVGIEDIPGGAPAAEAVEFDETEPSLED